MTSWLHTTDKTLVVVTLL